MALHINHPEVDRLVTELAARDKKTKTEVVLEALRESTRQGRSRDLDEHRAWLEARWAKLPENERGRMPTRDEEDEILGYGPHGYCE